MEEGQTSFAAAVPTSPTFTLMDLEALDTTPTPDDLLYYLTDQIATGDDGAHVSSFDQSHQLHPYPSTAPSSSFSSSPLSALSPVSSPLSSALSSATEGSSSSPSSSSSPVSSPSCLLGDEEQHFAFGSWLETAVESGPTIAPAQLQAAGCAPATAEEPGGHSAVLDDSYDSAEGSPMTPPPKETRKRKRAKKNETPLQTAVTLPRDELLKLSSQELEEYAENLRKVRKLTAEEEKDLRRQRRLIKNRESAQLSRVRKREQLEVLELQLQEVNAENARLKQQVDSLTAENQHLKDHIVTLNKQESAPLSPPVSPDLSSDELSGKLTEEDDAPSILKMVQGWTTLGKGATATAVKATYLFVILLSIGLFFNARYVHYGPGLGPFEAGPRGAPSIYQLPASAFSSQVVSSHESADKQASMLRAQDYAPRRHRDILQVEEGDSDGNDYVRPEKVSHFRDVPLTESLSQKSNAWRKEAPIFPMQSSPTMTTGEAANKTILMCPAVSPLQWPDREMSTDSDEITFILPSSAASYIPSSWWPEGDSFKTEQGSGQTIQLTCKIAGVRSASLSSFFMQ